MQARKEKHGGKPAARRGEAEAATKVFVGFWTSPAVKAAIQTRAMLDRKSASALMDEVVTDWVLCRRRK